MSRTTRHHNHAPAPDHGLQAELQQKACSLIAVQRNYDVLSRVLQQKTGELDEASIEMCGCFPGMFDCL